MGVLRILKGLTKLCAVTGTMPFTVVQNPSVNLKVSSLRSAWTCALVVLTLCNIYITPGLFIATSFTSKIDVANSAKPEINSTEQPPGSPTDDTQMLILKVLNPSIVFIMSLSSHFVTIFYLREKLPRFVCGYLTVNQRLAKLTKTQLNSNLHMLYFYGILIFPIPTFVFYICTVLEQSSMKLTWSMTQVLHNITSYSCEMQFVLFCHALGIEFRRINESFPAKSRSDLIWRHTWLHPRDSIFAVTDNLSVTRILLAQDCYLRLSGLLTHLNSMYSIQILFSMSGCFMKALLNVYFAFFGAHLTTNEPSLLSLRQIDILKTMSWTVYYSARFIVLAMVATYTIDEAEKTKFVVSALNNRLVEPSIKETLYVFLKNSSSQALKLTGCGLFTLKSATILSAFSAGMTYLFILIQYKLQIYFP